MYFQKLFSLSTGYFINYFFSWDIVIYVSIGNLIYFLQELHGQNVTFTMLTS